MLGNICGNQKKRGSVETIDQGSGNSSNHILTKINRTIRKRREARKYTLLVKTQKEKNGWGNVELE